MNMVVTTEMIINPESMSGIKGIYKVKIPKGTVFEVHNLDCDKDDPSKVWVETGPGNVIFPYIFKGWWKLAKKEINLL